MRSEKEIKDLISEVERYKDDESKFPGVTYEERIEATINWLFHGGENPMDDGWPVKIIALSLDNEKGLSLK